MASGEQANEKADSMALYAACLAATDAHPDGIARLFSQNELFEVYPSCNHDAQTLMHLVTDLSDRSLFRTLKSSSAGLSWSLRPRGAAAKIAALTSEERIVYAFVEDAHTNGAWVKNIRQRANVNQVVASKCVTKLEKAGLIKPVKSVKNPAQRTYILSHLVPSDDVTGGSFFDAGDLDESLIEELGNLIVFHVRQQSWSDSKRRTKRERSASPRPDRDEGSPERKRHRGESEVTEHLQLAYPASSRAYPNAEGIHKFLMESGTIRDTKAAKFTSQEVQQLIDVLVWDGKLEKVGAGYRTVRGVNYRVGESQVDMGAQEDEIGNGLTEAPCGRCPVADLCSADLESVVNAGNCAYFAPWLEAA